MKNKTKTLKTVVVAFAILLCFALTFGLAGAWFNNSYSAAGTIHMDQGIIIEYSGFEHEVVDTDNIWQKNEVNFKLFDVGNALPGAEVAISPAKIGAANGSVDFNARLKLEYKLYEDIEGTVENTTIDSERILLPGSTFIDSSWVLSTDGYYYYATDTTLNALTPNGADATIFAEGAKYTINPEIEGTGFGYDIEGTIIKKVDVVMTLETVQLDNDWVVELPTCLVTFSANGGTVEQSSVVVGKGELITLPSATRIGCIFNGWNTAEDGSGTSYGSGESYSTTSAATLYAQWTVLTAYFNSNWGNLLATDARGVETGITAAKAIFSIEFTTAMPIDEGYDPNSYILVGATARDSTEVNDSVVAYYYKDADAKYHLAIVGAGGEKIYAPKSCASLFKNFSAISTINLENFDVTGVTSMAYMFNSCNITNLDILSTWDVSSVTNMAYMFSGCGELVSLDLSDWNVSSVTSMKYMFNACDKLKSIGDVSGWKVGEVEETYRMFYNCKVLTELNLSSWDVSSITDMGYMFYGCQKITSVGDLSEWNVTSVTNISSMFNNCSKLTSLDLSGWNLTKVKTTSGIFTSCTSLAEVKAPQTIKSGYSIPLRTVSGKKWVVSGGDGTAVTEIGNDTEVATLGQTLVLVDA